MPLASAAMNVFLTGVTGFLGKVTLAEMLRQQGSIKLGKVYVLIREKRGKSVQERFAEMMQSPCFAHLSGEWADRIEVVSGALEQPQCGMAPDTYAHLCKHVHRIIHCAASVEFDLPAQQAAEANITASLRVLELARACRGLQRMVSVSTAYVTPHTPGPLTETLAPLPATAESLFDAIMAGTFKKEELLAATGHPNTYTLTKCIAEHLLVARRGKVPLRIVRPSIISAAWRYPQPGWVDSAAALAGFIMSIGAGYMRVVDAQWQTQLDVVPVDAVAERIIDQAFHAEDDAVQATPITYAVSGKRKAATIREWVQGIEGCFTRYPVGRQAAIRYLGPRGLRYDAHRLVHHVAPAKAAQWLYRARKMPLQERAVRRGIERLDNINRVFPYFTRKTFDFRPSTPLPTSFDVVSYIRATCEGVLRHLMHQDPTAVRLGGKKAARPASDVLWAMGKPQGNWAIRLSAATMNKVLRQVFDEVTIDQASFERAVARAQSQVGRDCQLVVLPTHRSYMDFLVCSYLFFARPGLNIPIPHIAAAQEFARIPAVGWLFKQMHAFYIKRGTKQADPVLTEHVHTLLAQQSTLEFFIEGQRSRSRHFLMPRRGLLRCLQQTGQRFVALPVALSYDRVPEESAFLRELKGYPKNKMQLRALLRWAASMMRGEIRLGRLHIACGEPLVLDNDVDVPAFSVSVLEQLQAHTAVSDYHLAIFAAAHPHLGITPAWLRQAIIDRGGTVLKSTLSPAPDTAIDPALERSLRNQWEHVFFSDACAWQPNNAAIADYVDEFGFAQTGRRPAGGVPDPQLALLLRALFAPVCADYQAVATTLKRYAGKKQKVAMDHILRRTTFNDYTTAVAALRALVRRGLLSVVDSTHYLVAGQPAAFSAFIARSNLAAPPVMPAVAQRPAVSQVDTAS